MAAQFLAAPVVRAGLEELAVLVVQEATVA